MFKDLPGDAVVSRCSRYNVGNGNDFKQFNYKSFAFTSGLPTIKKYSFSIVIY